MNGRARQDLRDTLTEVNAKLESVESDLRPDHLIEGHSVGVPDGGALGFLWAPPSVIG